MVLSDLKRSTPNEMSESPRGTTDSLFHKAASYSVIALLASIVLQFLLSGIDRGGSPDLDRFLLYIPTVVVISEAKKEAKKGVNAISLNLWASRD